jgi:hypothetical protein
MLVVDLFSPAAVTVSWHGRNGRVHENTFPNQCVQPSTVEPVQQSTRSTFRGEKKQGSYAARERAISPIVEANASSVKRMSSSVWASET